MSEFFVLLLMQVTIFSSVTALIIIAVKQIFKCRIPPKIGVVLWLVLLLRLVCPIFPESEFSVYNLIPAGRTIMYTLRNDIAEDIDTREAVRAAAENPYVLRETDTPKAMEPAGIEHDSAEEEAITIGGYINEMIDRPERDYTDPFNRTVLMIYAVGIAVTLTVSGFCYTRVRQRVSRMSVLCTDETLLRCYRETAEKMHIREKKIPPLRTGYTDMVIGCFNPSVICRDSLDPREASMVFAHELSHYKYGDNPILLFSTFVTCLFWYNPLIWLVRSILREDLEVLCDARTLAECGIPRTEYAMMLCRQSAFDVLHTDEIRAGCHMSATGRQLKTRLRTISRNAGERYLARVGSLGLCIVIVLLCLTNPVISRNEEYAVFIENYAQLTGKNERSMHLADHVTVSAYLEQLADILGQSGMGEAIGGGNLERFRRLCAGSENIDRDLLEALRSLRTTELLTYKNLTILNKCAAALLESDSGDRGNTSLLLPEVITAAEMNGILAGLTSAEGEALLDCYNLGVAGAEVTFEYVYTDAMMDLILSRIDDPWIREKFNGFYQPIDLSGGTGEFSSRLAEMVKGVRKRSLYVCDPGITGVETAMLQRMIGAAEAGSREDVYYLKGYEDLYSNDLAERLIIRSGYEADDLIRTYAEIGQMRYQRLTDENCAVLTLHQMEEITDRLQPADAAVFEASYETVTGITHAGEVGGEYETDSYRLKEGQSVQSILDTLNRVKFTWAREDSNITVTGVTEDCVEDAACELYALGILDGTDGVIDMTERLSCGQSLSCAYRFACAMTNAG